MLGEPFPDDETFNLSIWDGFATPPGSAPADLFTITIRRDLQSPDGTAIDLFFGFREEGADATLIEDLALPASPPQPTPGTVVSASVLLIRPETSEGFHNQQVQADLVSLISVVPEPALALFAGTAALALLARRRLERP